MKKLGDIIDTTEKPSTIKTMEKDLADLGIKHGDTVMVHTSLSKIGYIVHGATSLLQALINSVGEIGTLAMASQTTDNSDPENWSMPHVPKQWWQIIRDNMPPYDKYTTPTNLGVIPELFRTYPGTVRSDHPQTSFTARGKNANIIVENHQLSPSFGEQSPLGRLYDLGTKILLIGTDYDTITALHLSEVGAKRCSVSENACAMMIDSKRVWHIYNDYDYDEQDFIKIGQAFEKKYKVTTGKVGQATAKLMDMKELVDFAQIQMKNEK